MVEFSVMQKLLLIVRVAVALATTGSLALAAEQESSALRWKDCLRQKPTWYRGAEAMRVTENVLLYQRQSGGWPKNTEMAAVLSEEAKARLREEKSKTDSTIDNGATTTQLRFLVRVDPSTPKPELKAAILRGLDFLFDAQYPNGGWPQFSPKPKGYQTHITFNDDAMVNVLSLLREVGKGAPNFGFVDKTRQERAKLGVERGIECILKCQVVVNGTPTVWCAQHDENSFAPAPARAYEKISLSGGESVGIVRFLMGIDRPSPEVSRAIEGAVAWFRSSKITGLRQVMKPDPNLPKGYDKVVVEDAKAPALWARFYEIRSNRPIFCGRDGVIRYHLAEIEHERRVGYSWYTESPTRLLDVDYPSWRERMRKTPDH